MAWSLLIRNGTVVDGSGGPARAADVALEGERIAAVGPGLSGEAARVIDATGLMVAPGFIDAHSHSDLVYDKCPSAESKVRQGVTTEVVGMCSFSPAPVAPGRAGLVQEWAGGIGGKIPITWNSFGEYLDHLRGLGPTVNIAQFVGHGALRLAAVGPDARPVTPDEQRGMERLLAEALDAGAFGFSTGLVYAPSVYGSTDELVSLARSMATRRGLYFSHIRGEAATLEQAAEEAIRIGELGGVPVQIAHVKASGRENWPKITIVTGIPIGPPSQSPDPKSACMWSPVPIAATTRPESAATGSLSTRWFQGLDAGKTGQAGAPGTLPACATATPTASRARKRTAILVTEAEMPLRPESCPPGG